MVVVLFVGAEKVGCIGVVDIMVLGGDFLVEVVEWKEWNWWWGMW